MLDNELKSKLSLARSLDEAKGILKGHPDLVVVAERVWEELGKHRSIAVEKLDLSELDAVSGGADRDWQKDGYAATCEPHSWCDTNDYCYCWDVTYDNFWATCPDGATHNFEMGNICVRCGYSKV